MARCSCAGRRHKPETDAGVLEGSVTSPWCHLEAQLLAGRGLGHRFIRGYGSLGLVCGSPIAFQKGLVLASLSDMDPYVCVVSVLCVCDTEMKYQSQERKRKVTIMSQHKKENIGLYNVSYVKKKSKGGREREEEENITVLQEYLKFYDSNFLSSLAFHYKYNVVL